MSNSSLQIVAGVVYSFDAEFKWADGCSHQGESVTCQNFHIFKKLPVYCSGDGNDCFELTRSEQIKCIF